jgi:hypothetical protein
VNGNSRSREFDGTVVITVIAVRMMKVAVDQVVDVITMRYRFVSAARPVDMARIMGAAVMARCTSVRVLCADLKPVLVYMIGMRMMQVPVMQVIDVIAMFDGRVPAVRAVLMVVVGMMGFVAGAHLEAPRFIWNCQRVICPGPFTRIDHGTHGVWQGHWGLGQVEVQLKGCPPLRAAGLLLF